MKRAAIAAMVACALAGYARAEIPSLEVLPEPSAVLRTLSGFAQFKASPRGVMPKIAERAAADLAVYNFGAGFTVAGQAPGLQLRAVKTVAPHEWRVDGEAWSGTITRVVEDDPSWGFRIRGEGFDAKLERSGGSWVLSGTLGEGKDFLWRFARDYPAFNYDVAEPGLELRVETTSDSATLKGSYDPGRIAPAGVALAAIACGLINRPENRAF